MGCSNALSHFSRFGRWNRAGRTKIPGCPGLDIEDFNSRSALSYSDLSQIVEPAKGRFPAVSNKSIGNRWLVGQELSVFKKNYDIHFIGAVGLDVNTEPSSWKVSLKDVANSNCFEKLPIVHSPRCHRNSNSQSGFPFLGYSKFINRTWTF